MSALGTVSTPARTLEPVVGFVRGALLCVKRNGKPDLPDCDPGFDKVEMKFAMSCAGKSDAAGGCATLGYGAKTFRLVE